MRISDWSSDVCSSDLMSSDLQQELQRHEEAAGGDGDAIGHRLLGEGGIAAHEQQVRGNARPLDLVIEPKNQRHQATGQGGVIGEGNEKRVAGPEADGRKELPVSPAAEAPGEEQQRSEEQKSDIHTRMPSSYA